MVLVRYFTPACAPGGRLTDPVIHLPMLKWESRLVPTGAGQRRRRVDHTHDLVALPSLCRRVCILPDYVRSTDRNSPDRFFLNDLVDWAYAGERYNWQPGSEPVLTVTVGR